eukprot:PITA_15705
MLKYLFIEATILPVAGSNHWPVKLEIDLKQRPPNKPFRFEAFWLRKEGLMEKLEEWWRMSEQRGKNNMHTFQLKLKEMKNKIKKWNKEESGNITEDKKRLEQRMADLQQMDIMEGIEEERTQEEGRVLNQLEERRKQEEILWKQKSRVQWLREGERNTKFFHKEMVQHRQRNRIFSIKNQEGQRVIQHEEIEKVMVNHFKDILREPQTNRADAIAKISTEIPNVVTRDQNLALMRKITMEEVEDIVRNMKRNKAPGPDGYTVEFFQAGWKFLAAEVLEVVEEARINQRIWPGINSTLLTLIPKTNQAEQADGFRPIALCNVIYKIVASIAAQRLKLILPSIISPEKTGFVEGRQILDGLVVAQEVLHTMKTKKEKGMLIKLDLSKAYDRLSWKYLERILKAFGFCDRWVNWVISMISTLNFSILLNGAPTATFNASRGLRQGDPLSPFLFIISAEGLGRYFKKEARERKIQGLRLWGNRTTVTHQQFVDDIMIYCKATLKEVNRIKKILELFMDGSGMEVNKDKSTTFFFNTAEPVKNHLTRVMGYRTGDLPTKYLGTMLDTSTLKIGNWKNIIEKIMKRLDNWTFRALNLAVRVVLLKATIQAIPIYPLSVMAAPKGICNKLVEIYRKFLWGGPKQQKKWALYSWKSLTKPKEKGGLGVRDPWTLNQVLAAKLRWRWLQGGPDLWKEIWTVKYNMPLSPEGILRDQNIPRGSDIWNLSLQSRDLVDNHIFWEIRGGEIAGFWDEDWQQRGKMMNLQGMQEIHRTGVDRGLLTVKDYWNAVPGNEEWREWKPLEEWKRNATEEQIIAYRKETDSRKIKKRDGRDILRWGKETKGIFSIQEAYKLKTHNDPGEEEQKWKKIWKTKWWPKIKLFAWLVGRKRILTWDRIQKRGFFGPARCCLCNSAEEDQEHLLNGCSAAHFQWEKMKNLFATTARNPRDIIQTLTKSTGPEEIWTSTLKQIKETILAENWVDEDWKTKEAEIEILKKLNVEQGMIFHQASKQNFQLANQSRSVFRKPLEGFIKLNCDRAAKGNPGPAGFGGIFRNGEGFTEWIYTERGGTMTNNEEEFMAVYQGLKIARRNGYRKLEIEGDSTMVINAIRQLIQGKSWEKVVESWRSASTVRDIGELLKNIDFMITSHVRREGNKPADCLANWGSNERMEPIDDSWTNQELLARWDGLNQLIRKDNHDAEQA